MGPANDVATRAAPGAMDNETTGRQLRVRRLLNTLPRHTPRRTCRPLATLHGPDLPIPGNIARCHYDCAVTATRLSGDWIDRTRTSCCRLSATRDGSGLCVPALSGSI